MTKEELQQYLDALWDAKKRAVGDRATSVSVDGRSVGYMSLTELDEEIERIEIRLASMNRAQRGKNPTFFNIPVRFSR